MEKQKGLLRLAGVVLACLAMALALNRVFDADAAASQFTYLDGGTNYSDTGVTTDAFTCPADKLCLLTVGQSSSTYSPSLSDSGGRGWTPVISFAPQGRRISVYQYHADTDTTGSVTVSTVADNPAFKYDWNWTASYVNSDAVLQSHAVQGMEMGKSASVTLANSGNGPVAGYLVIHRNSSKDVLAGPGLTRLGAVPSNCQAPYGPEYSVICTAMLASDDFQQTLTAEWPTGLAGHYIFIGLEFSAAAASGEPAPPTATAEPPTPAPTSTPPAIPPTGDISFTRRTDLDSFLPLAEGVYPWNCHHYNPFPQPPNQYMTGDGHTCKSQDWSTYQGNPGNLVYESELSVVVDGAFPERGKLIKHYQHPSYPTLPDSKIKWDHHGLLMLDTQQQTIGLDDLCTGDCWYGMLLYFPMEIGPQATKGFEILGVGGGLTNQYAGIVNRNYQLRPYQAPENSDFIQLPVGTWVSLRAFVSAAGGMERLIVTDLDNNTLPGTLRELEYMNPKPYTTNASGAIQRVKFGVGGEEDNTFVNFTPGYYYYQDNMYIAAQGATHDPGVWK